MPVMLLQLNCYNVNKILHSFTVITDTNASGDAGKTY